ncbi:MAG: OmpA family protein, partial [Candidatus Omnitrophota bacterium]|nr:OmpA family protein [Candidatus Omnitrophota bacterium]
QELSALTDQLTQAKNKIAELEQAAGAKEEALSQNQSSLANLKNEKDQLANQLTQANQGASEQAVQLKASQEKVKALEALTEQLTQAKNKIAELETASSTKDQALNDNLSSLETLKTEKDQLANQLTQATQATTEQATQLKASQDKLKELSVLTDQLTSAKNKIAELEQAVGAKDVQVADLKSMMDKLKESLESELDSYKAKLEMAQRGIVVQVLTDVSFDSGSAHLSQEGKRIIQKIANVLENEEKNYRILIEGHTDNRPIQYSRWKSNWQLSSERALSVLDSILKESKIDPSRCSIAGFGEQRPIGDNSIPEGRRQNRRVEIIIQPEIIKIRKPQGPLPSGLP